jgi:predicted MFS family arabinose efflux permease
MDQQRTMTRLPGSALVGVVCAAQVFVQIGAFFWPALLPQLMQRWSLSNSDAGWITASFYGAYMLGVPVLVTLTDRVDAKKVYLFGVGATVVGHFMFGLYADGFWSALGLRALTGLGWAGTYMTGVKLLADQVDERLMSRAVTGHAASIGIAGALSFSCAGLLAQAYGWRAAFALAGCSAAIAFALVAFSVPAAKRLGMTRGARVSLFDFRPVLRNRSALAYSLAYCVHTLEMSALRGWGVAFLGFVAISTQADQTQLSPAYVLTVLGLIGTVASVLGNEAAIRVGRRTLVSVAMAASVVAGCSIGFAGTISYSTAVVVLLVYGFIVWLDSSSLTAGAAGTAEPARRGATLAVHSTLGYAGGFVGPLIIGFVLDMAGGMSTAAWSAAFGSVAILMLLSLITFRVMRPRELAGDRSTQ